MPLESMGQDFQQVTSSAPQYLRSQQEGWELESSEVSIVDAGCQQRSLLGLRARRHMWGLYMCLGLLNSQALDCVGEGRGGEETDR